MRTADEIRADWLACLLSAEPAGRPQAESALRELYSSAGLTPPEHVFWLDSPFAAAWTVGLLSEPHDFLWQRIIADLGRRKREREYMDHVRATLCKSTGQRDWKTLVAAAGARWANRRMSRFATNRFCCRRERRCSKAEATQVIRRARPARRRTRSTTPQGTLRLLSAAPSRCGY
jgi:hypothetical protein